MQTDNYVCFVCRKAFSRPGEFATNTKDKTERPCAQCGGALRFTGPKYTPPDAGADDEWKLDQALDAANLLARSPRFPSFGEEKLRTLRALEEHLLREKRRKKR